MKRLLFLAAFTVLIGPTVTQADEFNVGKVSISVTANRTSYDSAYDKVVLKIDGWTTDLPLASDFRLAEIAGTWTAGAGGGIHLTGTSSNWSSRTLNDYDAQDTDDSWSKQSWVDMSSKSSSPAASYTGTLPDVTSFTEGFRMTLDTQPYYALGPTDYTDDGFDNTLLGVFYVTKATQWLPDDTVCSGTCSFAHAASGSAIGQLSVVIIPEPSTLVLLASGLFGLLAYAWRKRK
jgi:hypothetical protein